MPFCTPISCLSFIHALIQFFLDSECMREISCQSCLCTLLINYCRFFCLYLLCSPCCFYYFYSVFLISFFWLGGMSCWLFRCTLLFTIRYSSACIFCALFPHSIYLLVRGELFAFTVYTPLNHSLFFGLCLMSSSCCSYYFHSVSLISFICL